MIQTIDATFPYYCTQQDRDQNCEDQDDLMVCGWFDFSRTRCYDYPCANTFKNPCLACKNTFVEKLTDGTCPKRPPSISKI